MVALGTIVVAALGLAIGFGGGLLFLLAGGIFTCVIATAQFVALHSDTGLYTLPAWPWGATSLFAYVLAVAIGLALSTRGYR